MTNDVTAPKGKNASDATAAPQSESSKEEAFYRSNQGQRAKGKTSFLPLCYAMPLGQIYGCRCIDVFPSAYSISIFFLYPLFLPFRFERYTDRSTDLVSDEAT